MRFDFPVQESPMTLSLMMAIATDQSRQKASKELEEFPFRATTTERNLLKAAMKILSNQRRNSSAVIVSIQIGFVRATILDQDQALNGCQGKCWPITVMAHFP